MQEYVGEAIVLDKEDLKDLDSRVTFFTKRYGKLIAKAKSTRKIVSKLSSHLEPGNLVKIRLVERHGLMAVDALKQTRVNLSPHELQSLGKLLPEGEPEFQIWRFLNSGAFDWRRIFQILGWNPEGVRCMECKSKIPNSFRISTQEFFCETCSSNLEKKDILFYV